MLTFKKIDPKEWVNSHSESKGFWKKSAKVKARKAVPGETIVTIMKDGHEETTNTAKENQMVVKNPDGEEYIIDNKKFNDRYKLFSNKVENKFKTYIPVSDPIRPYFLEEDENVEFDAPWGETMKIKGGGVIINNGPNDIYGIQKNEFYSTYSKCDKDGKFLD